MQSTLYRAPCAKESTTHVRFRGFTANVVPTVRVDNNGMPCMVCISIIIGENLNPPGSTVGRERRIVVSWAHRSLDLGQVRVCLPVLRIYYYNMVDQKAQCYEYTKYKHTLCKLSHTLMLISPDGLLQGMDAVCIRHARRSRLACCPSTPPPPSWRISYASLP